MAAKKTTLILPAALLAAWLLVPVAGRAQVEVPPILEPSPSPTPTKSSSPKPRATSSSTPRTGSSPRPATRPRPAIRPTPERARPASPAVDPVVARGLAIWNARERTSARTTTKLLALLERAGGGASTLAERRDGFGRFPVVGYVWYQDDWAAPRYLPYFHLHEGTDLFAARGTPVTAVADGSIVKLARGGASGNAIWLLGDDGVRYFYGHLQRFVRGMKVGRRVAIGDLIAYVGDTGTAKGTYPHVHFEVNPGGLGTVNPKPLLDLWLRQAENRALSQIGFARSTDSLAILGAARWDSLFALLAEPTAPAPAFWAAGVGGAGGTIVHADLALASLQSSAEWVAPAAAGASAPHMPNVIEAFTAPEGS